MEAIARGVKKPLSKLGAHLQVLDLSDIEFVLGKRFKVLTGARLIKNIVADIYCLDNKCQMGDNKDNNKDNKASFFNFLDEITPLEDPDSRIWQLCLDIVNYQNSTLSVESARQQLLQLTGFAMF